MGRRAKATREAVRRAVVALRAEGQLPPFSVRAVLRHVGAGSLTTIMKLLRELEAERPELFVLEPSETRDDEAERVHQMLFGVHSQLTEVVRLIVGKVPSGARGSGSDSPDDQGSENRELRRQIKMLENKLAEKDQEIARLRENKASSPQENISLEKEKNSSSSDDGPSDDGPKALQGEGSASQSEEVPSDLERSQPEPSLVSPDQEKTLEPAKSKKTKGSKSGKPSGDTDQLVLF